MMVAVAAKKTEQLNVRISPQMKRLYDAAKRIGGLDNTRLVQAALLAAIEDADFRRRALARLAELEDTSLDTMSIDEFVSLAIHGRGLGQTDDSEAKPQKPRQNKARRS